MNEPATPPAQQPLIPVIQQQPDHRTRTVISAITLAILLAAIPVGVYLSLNPQSFKPQASNEIKVNPQNTILLEEDTKSTQNDPNSIAVNVFMKSDFDASNLLSTDISFSSDQLAVSTIDTTQKEDQSLTIKKWIRSDYDNKQGLVHLVVGFPAPGRKTDPTKNEQIQIATIFFHIIKQNQAQLKVLDTSAIYRNSDNRNILKQPGQLTINTSDLSAKTISATALATPSAVQNPYLTSPKSADVFAYDTAIPINWPEVLTNVDITVLLNNQNLGRIATNLSSAQSFNWSPSTNLPVGFVTSSNTFKVSVDGKNKKGQAVKYVSEGPFGIVLDKSQIQDRIIKTSTGSANADLNSDSNTDYFDLSVLFSNYLLPKLQNPTADLNGDGVVNDLDLWMLTKILLPQINL